MAESGRADVLNEALRAAEDAGLISVSRGEVRLLDFDGLVRRARY
jgi:hypothetical protein